MMKIRAGYNITYNMTIPVPMTLMLSVHSSRAKDVLTSDVITFDPPLAATSYEDQFGNVCTRITPDGPFAISADFVVDDPGILDPAAPDAIQHPVEELPDDVLVFLLGSRYCDTDKLSNLAWSLFGHVPPGWARAQAICDFVHNHIRFDYQRADGTRTAFDGYQQREGVCRDFAHLAIAFCRCMNIPARYCTGFLGDIGVPKDPAPMDFSAWFEVYLGGRWHTFDARHNVPRIGRIVMARGRDATDVALSTAFGPTWLGDFTVKTDEVIEAAISDLKAA